MKLPVMRFPVILNVAKNLLHAALLLLPLSLGAQEVRDGTGYALNQDLTLWAGSSNAAGLAISPYRQFNILSGQYKMENGEYRQMQTGTQVGDLEFDTQGAKRIGKVQVWGRFRYNNVNDKGSSFNTLLYDPYDERFMYTAADTVAGQWKKQAYEMQFKAAMPLGEIFSAGVHVKYTDRIAAGQIDPRAESYHYSVVARPGLVWTAGKSRIGANGLYSNTFERTTPSISNSEVVQKVFLMRGLGNWVGEQVGGGGLSTMYFRCNTWGGAIQYAYDGSWELFSELSYASHLTRITESATQPKPHGRTRQQELGLNAAAVLRSERFTDKFSMNVGDVRTIGIEPTALWNGDKGEWEVQMELEQCKFSTSDVTLSYDRYLKDGDGYKWHLNGKLGFEAVHKSYASPLSEFQYGLLTASAGTEYKFRIGNGALLAGASAGWSKNLGNARYEYNGHRTGTAPVEVLYPHNLSILSADRLQGGISAEYCIPVGKVTSLAFCAEGDFLYAYAISKSRTALLGAVRLYF